MLVYSWIPFVFTLYVYASFFVFFCFFFLFQKFLCLVPLLEPWYYEQCLSIYNHVLWMLCSAFGLEKKKKNLTTLVRVLYQYASVSFLFFSYLFLCLIYVVGSFAYLLYCLTWLEKKLVSFLMQVCNTSRNMYPFITFSYWFIWRRWNNVTNENKMIPNTP